MSRCSNLLLGLLNVITFILSLPIVGYGVWLATKSTTECDKVLALPLVIFGACLTVLSLIGICGAWWRTSLMLCLYLTVMAVAILAFGGFAGFVLAVTHKDPGENDQQFQLHDRTHWLKKKVNDNGNWEKIKSCLTDMNVCASFAHTPSKETAEKFYSGPLTSIQSGCCKPADDCKFTYEGPFNWNKANGNNTNPDCSKWGNTVDNLCYNCASCKAGVVDQIQTYWKTIAISNASILGLLIVLYILGICACSNSMSRKNHSDMYNPYNNPYYYPQSPRPSLGGPRRRPGGPYP